MSRNDETEILLWCRNPKCGRYKQLFAVHPDLLKNRNYCVRCGSRLKIFDYTKDEFPIAAQQPSAVDAAGVGAKATSALALIPKPLTWGPDVGADIKVADCVIQGCPIAPASRIELPFSLWAQWIHLCRQIPTEWFAYLKGAIAEEGAAVILAPDGMYFPKQRVQAAHVSVEPLAAMEEGTVASVHSHVDMEAVFSVEDREHFSNSADLVVNRRGELSAVVLRKLECGRMQRVTAKVALVGHQPEMGCLDLLRAAMTVEAATVSAGPAWYRGGGNGYEQRGKGERGLTVYSSDAAERYLRDEHTFRRTDGGRWEDLRD